MVVRDPSILLFAHGFLLGISFVLMPDEVQVSMDDNAKQLVEKQLFVLLRVVLDSVDRKHQISRDLICCAVVKRDDVGVVIML